MDAHFTRADRELAVEKYGRIRVLDGINRLFRHNGLGMLTPDALDDLLRGLQADAATEQRINAANRSIRLNAESGRV